MAKSYKLKNDNYIDSANIMHNRVPLPTKLSEIPTVTSGTFNYDNSYFSTVDFHHYIKYGKVVICEFRGLISNNIPDNTPIFTLPFLPNISGEITLYLGGQYDYQNTIWAYTTTDSPYLKVGNGASGASGKYLHAYFVYICQ